MGIEINKSGKPIEEIYKIHNVPQAITQAQASDNFVYKEPEFKVENGVLFGGDLKAFDRLQVLMQKQSSQEEPAVQEAFVSSSAIAPEMC